MKVVETAQGKLSGVARDGVTEYRGVPFAASTDGEYRLAAPRPATPWSGVREANRFAPSVLQEKNPLMGIDEIGGDSLCLNIWVPEGDGPFPVMVWFHGGGYLAGSPSQRLYEGAFLARRQQVIVVNAAYRLGITGYGWAAELLPGIDAPGNAGLRDQVAALEWVNENIAAFAGDTGRITLFGESAGGFSVATLLATPAAAPLFQRAITQSGAGDMVLAPDEAARVTQLVLEALPGSGSLTDRLLKASDKDLVRAQRVAYKQLVKRGLRDSTPQFSMSCLPVVDGDFLPRVPVQAIADGAARDKALMAGCCRDEWHLFQYAPPFNGGVGLDRLRDLPENELERRFDRALPLHAGEALVHYRETVTPDPRRGVLDIASAMETDRLFRVPTLRLLDAQVAAGGEAWGFQFTWETEAFGVPLGACHVVDVPFVFDLIDSPMGQLFTGGGEAADSLAKRVGQAWSDFARGKPPGWADWSGNRRVHCFGREETETNLLEPGSEQLWDKIIPAPTSDR